MKKEKAGEHPAQSKATSKQYINEPASSQGVRILNHLICHGRLTTIEARGMGIMHPGMRVCELRKRGAPIDTVRAYQADESGAVHFCATYLWRGQDACQGDLFAGGIRG